MKPLLICILFSISCFCNAQTAKVPLDKEDIPPGPLIAPGAADFAKWTVTYNYASGPHKNGAESDAQKNLKQMAAADPAMAKLLAEKPEVAFWADYPRITAITIIKTHDVIQQQITYERGFSGEKWAVKGADASMLPGTPRITVRMVGASGAAKDFPGFDWISKDNFTGTKKVNGRDCLIFSKEMFRIDVGQPDILQMVQSDVPANAVNVSDEGVKIPVVATIDAETRLPVVLQIAGDARLYVFSPPPSGMLTVPEQFIVAINQSLRRYQSLTKPLSPP